MDNTYKHCDCCLIILTSMYLNYLWNGMTNHRRTFSSLTSELHIRMFFLFAYTFISTMPQISPKQSQSNVTHQFLHDITPYWFWGELTFESFEFLRGPLIVEKKCGAHSFWGDLMFFLHSEGTYMFFVIINIENVCNSIG